MNLRKIKTRKSGVEDIIFVMVFIFAFAIFFVVLIYTWNQMKVPLNTGLSSSMPSDSSVNVSEIIDDTTGSTNLFDKLFPFLLIGLFGFVLLTAGAMMQHPVMIVVGVIVLGVGIMLAVIYSNVYDDITSTAQFEDTKSTLTITDSFMKFLPGIVIVLFVIIGAVIWSRRGGTGVGY